MNYFDAFGGPLVDPEDDPPLPTIRTERFLIHHVEVMRPENLGGMPRSMFTAWHHTDDIPRPLCTVIVNQCFSNFVEWVHVDEAHRRQGIATEVLRAVELEVGGLTMDGATEAGTAFCEAYEALYPEPVE